MEDRALVKFDEWEKLKFPQGHIHSYANFQLRVRPMTCWVGVNVFHGEENSYSYRR